jgi:hypothetical protein
MPQFFPRHGGSLVRWLHRLDRASELINPFLIVIAIGLAVLDSAWVIALIDTGRLPVHRGGPDSAFSSVASTEAPVR